VDGDSRVCPIVALSFQRVRFVHVGIIHGNQQDRNSGGEIWSRDDIRDGTFLEESNAGRVIPSVVCGF